MLRKLLLATAALAALTTAGNAAVVGDLGINPTSSAGAFSNQNLPTGVFADQWTFQLAGAEQHLTIASATNVFPQISDFITNFNGSVFEIVGTIDPTPGTAATIFGCWDRRSVAPVAARTARSSAVRQSSLSVTTI